MLRDNPLGHTATRHLVRALQQRPGGEGALKQVGGGGRGGEGALKQVGGGKGEGNVRGSHLRKGCVLAGLDQALPVKLRCCPPHTPSTSLVAPLTSSPLLTLFHTAPSPLTHTPGGPDGLQVHGSF